MLPDYYHTLTCGHLGKASHHDNGSAFAWCAPCGQYRPLARAKPDTRKAYLAPGIKALVPTELGRRELTNVLN